MPAHTPTSSHRRHDDVTGSANIGHKAHQRLSTITTKSVSVSSNELKNTRNGSSATSSPAQIATRRPRADRDAPTEHRVRQTRRQARRRRAQQPVQRRGDVDTVTERGEHRQQAGVERHACGSKAQLVDEPVATEQRLGHQPVLLLVRELEQGGITAAREAKDTPTYAQDQRDGHQHPHGAYTQVGVRRRRQHCAVRLSRVL